MRRFFRLLALSLPLMALLALLEAAAASAADATYQVPIGRVLVELPVPPGFIEPSRSVPPLRTLGELRGLDVFDEREGSISLLAMTKLALQQAGGQVLEIPITMSITTARVKDKLVYFYAYSQYRDKADLDWLRSTTREWLPRLAAAN